MRQKIYTKQRNQYAEGETRNEVFMGYSQEAVRANVRGRAGKGEDKGNKKKECLLTFLLILFDVLKVLPTFKESQSKEREREREREREEEEEEEERERDSGLRIDLPRERAGVRTVKGKTGVRGVKRRTGVDGKGREGNTGVGVKERISATLDYIFNSYFPTLRKF